MIEIIWESLTLNRGMCYNPAMKTNVIIVGFMGAGKSLISKKLAKLLKLPVVSTDDLIVEREKRSINKIFEESKEPYFRQVEKTVVKEVAQKDNCIIDCGGGVVLDSDNITVLKENGIVFYLSATPDEIFQRIAHQKHRPLLKTENPRGKIEELLEKREAFYAQADYTIDTNRKDPDAVCDEIAALIKAKT